MLIGGVHDGEVTPPSLHGRVPPAGRRDGPPRGSRHRRSLAPALALAQDADQPGQACGGGGSRSGRRRAPPRGHGSRGRVVAVAAGGRRTADGARHPEKVGGVLRRRVMARYAVIKGLRRGCPVRLLCRVLEVPTGGCHAWRRGVPSERERSRGRLKLAAPAADAPTRQTYGARRLQRELAAGGFVASPGTVRRVRRELGLRCVQRERRFRITTTDSRHSPAVAPNLLAQDFQAARPGEVRTADITYVPAGEGWLYLAAIKGRSAGEIVGRSFGARVTAESVVRAFGQAAPARRPAPGLMRHSDRGPQYCGHEYQGLVASDGVRVSMSRKGDCYDDAPVESFRGALKTELVHHRRYRT